MQELAGRTAFVTGGASGFGFALARALLAERMRVMVADLDAEGVGEAVRRLGAGAAGLVCDVTDPAQLHRAADETVERFGGVHLVCNNAGVLAPGPLHTIEPRDWRWSFDVNVLGVVFGIEAFLPKLRAQAEGGWFLNTASMAGFRGLPGAGAYCATKAAAISVSESLAAELADTPVGVTILCPGFMRTRLHDNSLKRPQAFGGAKAALMDPAVGDTARLASAIEAGISADDAAALAIRGVKAGVLYVVTHPEHRGDIAAKGERILAAYHDAALWPGARVQPLLMGGG